MTREFQIRVSDDNDHEFDCICYTNLAEANAAYNAMAEEDTEGATYHLELVEVLRQDEICRDSEYNDGAFPRQEKSTTCAECGDVTALEDESESSCCGTLHSFCHQAHEEHCGKEIA